MSLAVPSSYTKACPQCGAAVPHIDGPTHKYVPSSPGCWRTFGEVQADELQRFGYSPAHRLVVDAYMAQHPGDSRDRRDRQSVFVHLIGLCAVLEAGLPPSHATRLLGRAVEHRGEFPGLERGGGPGEINVLHMVGATNSADYERRAREWGLSVWDSWMTQQELVRGGLQGLR